MHLGGQREELRAPRDRRLQLDQRLGGADLGVEGYSSITIEDKIIYGDKAWINVTAENSGDYDY